MDDITVFLTWFYGIGFVGTVLIIAFSYFKAPEGYENKTGFHYGRPMMVKGIKEITCCGITMEAEWQGEPGASDTSAYVEILALKHKGEDIAPLLEDKLISAFEEELLNNQENKICRRKTNELFS